MTVQASATSLERELEYRKKLTGITNQINAAESIPHILMTSTPSTPRTRSCTR
jgi:hypothetical protein